MTELESSLLGIFTAHCHGPNDAGLDRILPPERTRFYAYGRQALVAALRCVGVGAGDRVLLPGFICREVLSSIAAVGAIPCFYEVDQSLCSDVEKLEQARHQGVRAVVVVNYFGFPQPLAQIQAWCRANKLPLIEDNAHGFLSQEGDLPLGCRGDVGVFSLRKTLVLPNGAALIDNRSTRLNTEEDIAFQGSPVGTEWRYRFKVGLKRVMRFGNLRSAQAMVSVVRGVRFIATGESIPSSNAKWETNIPEEGFSLLTLQLIRHCHFSAERERRRALYRRLGELFEDVPAIQPLFRSLPEGVVPQGFPFLFTGDDSALLARSWWRRGVPIVSWPGQLPTAVQSDAPMHYRRVMLAQFLW